MITFDACGSFALDSDSNVIPPDLAYFFNLEQPVPLNPDGSMDYFVPRPIQSFWTFNCSFNFRFQTPGWKDVHVFVTDQYDEAALAVAGGPAAVTSLTAPAVFVSSWITRARTAAPEAHLAFFVASEPECFAFRAGVVPAGWVAATSPPLLRYSVDRVVLEAGTTYTLFIIAVERRNGDLADAFSESALAALRSKVTSEARPLLLQTSPRIVLPSFPSPAPPSPSPTSPLLQSQSHSSD